MNVLDLCAGYGGFSLALKLLGDSFRTICYVERDAFCQALLVARMEEKALDPAPLWDDVTTFDGRRWRGKVDIVTAGFPCFAAGTYILTATGYRAIETIREGDLVLTHNGNWKPVTALMVRHGAPVRKITAGGCPGLITTDEHPFLCRSRAKRGVSGIEKGRLESSSIPAWTKAEDIQPSKHYVSQTLPTPGYSEKTTDYWWLVGYYLANGWRVSRRSRSSGIRKSNSSPGGRVVLCGPPSKEEEICRRITAAGFNYSRVQERTTTKFHITKTEFWTFLSPFGTYAHGKTLPGFALQLDADRSRSLLEGLLFGDGYTDSRGDHHLTTVSESLALGVALLSQRAFGVVAGVRRCKRPPTTRIEGREVNQRDFFVVNIPTRNRSAWVDGDYGWKLVRKNEPAGIATVYNIAVADDESYIASGCIVHNCQPHSLSGKRGGSEDSRYIWPDILRIIREVGPGLVLLENVRGLLSLGFGEILKDLADAGYDAEWGMFSAEEVGAPHRRNRVFVVAYPRGKQLEVLEGVTINNEEELKAVARGMGIALWDAAPSDFFGDVDGPPSRMDRLRTLGNGIVPLQAAVALRDLFNRIRGCP